MAIKSYRDLKVWQKAIDLVVESYKVVSLLPKNETYCLATQIQRAAVSIPANIAEGHGREHLGDYLHHLSCANGSLMELETHFLIAGKLSYITESQLESVLNNAAELGRMLAGLIGKLKARASSPDT
jgi:four helix bundle protein